MTFRVNGLLINTSSHLAKWLHFSWMRNQSYYQNVVERQILMSGTRAISHYMCTRYVKLSHKREIMYAHICTYFLSQIIKQLSVKPHSNSAFCRHRVSVSFLWYSEYKINISPKQHKIDRCSSKVCLLPGTDLHFERIYEFLASKQLI